MFVAALLLGSTLPPPQDDDDLPRTVASAPKHDDDADDDEARAQPQSAIVITAHRLDTARTEVDPALGATVYSVTNETIESRPGGETGSVAGVLTQAPGVSLSGKTLNVRGSAVDQVRINNVIIPEAISDAPDLLSSRLAETSRLLTGALPAQYGFSPGGVISITTKNGLYEHGGQAELFGGSDGMLEPAFECAGSAAATSLFASADLERDRSSVSDANGVGTKDRRRQLEGLGFADHVVDGSNRVSLIFGGSRERHSFGPTSIAPGLDRRDDGYAIGTFQHSEGGFSIQGSAFVGVEADRMRFARATHDRRSTVGVQVDGSDHIGTTHVVRFGLFASRLSADEQPLNHPAIEDSRTAAAAYAQDEWQLTPSLTFNPGARIEWLNGLGSAARIEPRASLVWQTRSGTTAHVGYARYASAPPLGQSVGPALRDERDDSFHAGIQQRLGGLTLGLDAYSRTARNYIAEHRTIGSAVPAAFEFGRARFRGVEVSATYSRGPVATWANLALASARGRTILGGEMLFAPEALGAASDRWIPLASDRPVTASAGLTWRLGKLSLSGDMVGSSGAVRTRAVDLPNGSRRSGYAAFNLAAVYHASIAGAPADLRVDLVDLTNRHYATNDATSLDGGWTQWTEGRAVTVGIEQGF